MSADHPRWLSLAELRTRRSYKWRAHPADVLPTFVAEMDVTLADPVTHALQDAVAAGDTGYATPDPELAEAVARFHLARFGWHLEPAAVRLIPDVMTGVTEVLRQAVPAGSGVVVNTPVYPPFFTHIAEAGCRVVEAPLARAGDGYALDLDAVEATFAAGAPVYLLCNPHNPTGLVLAAGELRRIAELAERFQVLVLADEIHAPLTLPGARHTPYLSLPEARPHGIALVSASKAWNLPGLKCAQLVTGSDPMRALAAGLPEELVYGAGNLGVIASIAAYRDGGEWLDGLLALIDENRRLLGTLLADRLPEVGYVPPQGTYLAWLDCSRLGLPEEPARVFLKRGRVALRPGPDFGTLGRGWVRATIATAPEILTEIVERMRSAVG
ncbi:MAG: aminotransferase class I/II-fold pyridoxal phosphate-dependent enzyme [Candidatus Dormibacteria bacterium]|jgi:cystathionine beta-lyase